MPKHHDQTHAGKPSTGAKGSAGDTGDLAPGTMRGAGGDISGNHPPEYGEIDGSEPVVERDADDDGD